MSYGNRNRSGGYGGGSRGGGGYRGGGGRYGDSSMSGPKPVEIGKEYNVEISELSRRGDGLAKIQGFVIFVKGSKVGDKVKIKVETVGPRFATASVVGNSAPGEAAASSSSEGAEKSSEGEESSSSSSSSMTEPVS